MDSEKRSALISKIGLGSVQFGITYGINSVPAPSSEEVKEILNLAYTNEITTLDTSSGYGNAEQVLGQSGLTDRFNIVSKYSSNSNSVSRVFEISKERLNVNSLYGYLIHYFDLYKENKSIWNEFLRLKDEGKVQKIGFSIYDFEELNILLHDKVEFNLLQIPYNILDTELSPYLKELKDRGVEIHVRSVYLQGLFFKKASELPVSLSPLADYLIKIGNIAEDLHASVGELALNYVVNNPYIDKVILGVHSIGQLERNIRSVRNLSFDEIKIPIREEDKKLLKPKNWKL